MLSMIVRAVHNARQEACQQGLNRNQNRDNMSTLCVCPYLQVCCCNPNGYVNVSLIVRLGPNPKLKLEGKRFGPK